MIVMQLSGGLGNQLFQYACGRALSLRHNKELMLDPSILGLARAKRTYQLYRAFGIQTPLLPSHVNIIPKVLETHYHFDESILSKKEGYFIGYWQSEKYFKDFEETIRKDFTVANSNPFDEKSVSIHIRRGDYITDKHTNSIHGVCSIEYYKDCIEYITNQIKNPKFFLFTDDRKWVEKNFPVDGVIFSGERPDYEEMQLMSKCSHNILANSSFSWWGAWMNTSPNKIVCAPRKWFLDKNLNTKDLIPDGWIRL